MLYLPTIENREPLELCVVLERLNEIMSGRNFGVDCAKHYWICEEGAPKPHYHWLSSPVYLATINPYDIPEKGTNWWGYPLPKTTILARNAHEKGLIQSYLARRDDVQNLKKEVNKYVYERELFWLAERACGGSTPYNWVVINYLLNRACDIHRYGEKIADLTFPQPTIKGEMREKVAYVVGWAVRRLQKLAEQDEEKEEKKVLAEYEQRLHKFSKRVIPMPENLAPLVLSQNEIEAVKTACLRELSQSEK
jgi:hypothetical protein